MTKAIILNTSPRVKGNCDLVAAHMAERMQSAGAEVKLVNFREAKIGYCQGCDACKAKDEAWCVQNDDWSAMIPEIESCDAFVVLTPIYFGDITAQAKTVLDRIYPWFNPAHENMTLAKKFGKKVAVLTTCGGSPVEDCEQCAESMAGALGIAGFTEKRVLSVNGVNPKASAMDNADYLTQVDNLTDWLFG